MQTQKISLWQRVLAMFTALTMMVLMVPQASLPVYAVEGTETIQLTVNVTVKDEKGNLVKGATVTADHTVLGATGDDGVYRNESPQSFTVPEGVVEIVIGVSKDGYPTQEFRAEISTGNSGENRSVSYENDSIQLKRTFEASVSGDTITVSATNGSEFFADDGIALNISEVTTAGAFTISGDNKTATAQIRSVAGKVGEQVEFKVTVNGNEVGDANGNPLKVTVPGAKLSVKNGENTVSQIEVGESATLVPVFYSLSGEKAGYSDYTYSANPNNAVSFNGDSVKAISASSSVTITVTDTYSARTGGVEISTVKKSNGVLSCEKLGVSNTWQTTYTGSSQALNKSDFKFNGQEIGDNGTFSITYKKGDAEVPEANVKDAGIYNFTATYSDETYAEATLTGTIVIDQAPAGAAIVGEFPQSLTYGDSVRVQVSAGVPGTWSGTGMVGNISAGKDETPTIQLNTSAADENLNLVFTPQDSTNYKTETVQSFTVQKKDLTVTVTFPSKPFDNSTAVVANTPVPKESYEVNHTDRDAYYEVAGLTDTDAEKTFAITLPVDSFAFVNKGAVSGVSQVPISYIGSTPVIKLNDEDSENYQVAVAANPANITRVDFSDKYSLPVDGAVPQYVDGNGITWYQGSTITVTAAAGYHIAAGTLDLNAVPFEFGNAENVALIPDTENK